MNLTYIANIRFPTEKAHGLQIANMCQAFSKSDFNVTLVVPNRENYLDTKNSSRLYGWKKNFSVKKLFVLDLLRYTKATTPAIIKNTSFLIQSLSFSLRAIFYLTNIPTNAIIYSRDTSAFLPCFLMNRPIFFEIHTFPRTFIGQLAYKLVLRKAAGAIFTSQSLKNLFITARLLGKNSLVAHNAISIDDLPSVTKRIARKKLKLLQNKTIILYTGSFFYWKGVNQLIDANSLLPDNTFTVLIGGSPIETSTQKTINKVSKLNPHKIIALEHVPRSKLLYYLKAADILVLPTVSNSPHSPYSSPLKLFEYLAAKKPIVATDLSSLKEIVDQESVILVKPDSFRSLANGILKAINQPKLSRSLSQQAFEISKQYTWNVRAQKIANFIQQTQQIHPHRPSK